MQNNNLMENKNNQHGRKAATSTERHGAMNTDMTADHWDCIHLADENLASSSY